MPTELDNKITNLKALICKLKDSYDAGDYALFPDIYYVMRDLLLIRMCDLNIERKEWGPK